MRTIRYTRESLQDLRRHGNMAARIRKAMNEYAADPAHHANKVKQLVGSPTSRMRVGDFRVIFAETPTEITVLKIGPRGGVYD